MLGNWTKFSRILFFHRKLRLRKLGSKIKFFCCLLLSFWKKMQNLNCVEKIWIRIFMVCIFSYFDWIWRFTEISEFSPNAVKYRPKKQQVYLFVYLLINSMLIWSKFYKKSWIIGTNLGQSQSAFTCSKSTMETLEQCVQFVQKLTIKTPEWCQWGVFTVNFEQISQIAAMLIITLDITQSEALLGTSETFKTELFAKIING